MSKALPKNGSACSRVQVTNTRLGAASDEFVEVPMRPCQKPLLMLISAIGIGSPAFAQSPDLSSNFFAALGGSTNINTVGGEKSPEARPLLDHGAEILGARYFKEKATDDPFLAADRGIEIFRSSCSGAGGEVTPGDDWRTKRFFDRVAAQLVLPTGYKHQWRAKARICDDSSGNPIAGYLAVLQDNSEVMRSGDPGSQLLGSVFGLKTTTAIYLFKADRLPTRESAEINAQIDERDRQRRLENVGLAREKTEQFQKNLTIGDESNCGAVIDIRGPMAEIAVPALQRAPNGATTFWSRIDRLLPVGFGLCSYGL